VKSGLFHENQDFGIRGLFAFQKRNLCLNSKAVNHFGIFTEKKSKIIFEKKTIAQENKIRLKPLIY